MTPSRCSCELLLENLCTKRELELPLLVRGRNDMAPAAGSAGKRGGRTTTSATYCPARRRAASAAPAEPRLPQRKQPVYHRSSTQQRGLFLLLSLLVKKSHNTLCVLSVGFVSQPLYFTLTFYRRFNLGLEIADRERAFGARCEIFYILTWERR